MALPQLSQEGLVRKQDHKASAAWPTGRSVGWLRLPLSAPPDLTGKAFRSLGWPGQVQRAEQWREGGGFRLQPLRNVGLSWKLGCLGYWLAGLHCSVGFLLSLFPLRASDILSVTCFCGYLRGEMVAGHGAKVGRQDLGTCGGQRSEIARSPRSFMCPHPNFPLVLALPHSLVFSPHFIAQSPSILSFFIDPLLSSFYSLNKCLSIVSLCQAMF